VLYAPSAKGHRRRLFRPTRTFARGILSGTMPEVRPAPSTKARKLLSVPVSPAQWSELVRRAGAMPIAAYVRAILFPANDNRRATRIRTKAPPGAAALTSILAKLGGADIRRNLDDMARLARLGALPLTPETEAALMQACRDVAAIKSLLMRALRIRER
jgi:hypothetical protein